MYVGKHPTIDGNYCCFAELFYNPEDGGDMFLRNIGYHSTHYTASYPRRRYSSSSLKL
jgi:hypothetical protein